MDESTIHILLVEDEKDHAKLVCHAFERHAGRFHLTVAGNLEQARAYLAESLPDLVIADWLLPDGRGTDLLPATGEVRRFPLIVMTSHGNEQVAVKAMKAGALDYVIKSKTPLGDMPRVAERALREWDYIMDRQRAEEALRESEERYRTMIETANDIIWTLDTEGHFTFVNHQAEIVSGYQSEEVEGKLFAPPIYPDDLEMVNEVFRKTLSGESHQYTVKCYKKNDEIFILSVNTAPIYEKSEVIGTVSFGRDITARVRAEEALRKSEEQFRLIAENTSDNIAIITFDLKPTYLYVSPSVKSVLGYDPKDLLGKSFFDFIHPDDKKALFPLLKKYVNQKIKKLLIGKESDVSETIEFRFKNKTGDWRFMQSTVNIAGKQLLSVTRDITESKKVQEALQESERQLQTLIDAMPDFICFKDGDGRWLKVNDASIRIFRLEGINYRGKKDSELAELNSKLRGAFLTCKETDARVWKERELIHGEETVPDTDGSVRVFDVIKVPVSHPGGERKGLVIIGHDITERKQAEEERERLTTQVREQARQTEQILTTVPEGVLLLDAEGQVLLANPVAEGDLAVLAAAQVGDIITRLGDRPLAELLTSPPTKGMWHEVKAEGRIFEVIARPMENIPEPENWVLVIRNVTQEREIQRRTQQQERLVSLGQLAAGVAHDFNNIMTTIILYTQMSLNAPDLPSKIRQRLETVSGQAYRATDLVQQILDFSRRAVLERRPMDLTPFLKEVVKVLERTMPESIKIEFTYGADEYTVHADPTRVQQAIINLALNARDAMLSKGCGELRIELERVQVKSHRESPLPEMEAGEWVRVRVNDTGSGIPPEVLSHIFEPFFTTKEVDQGTGLGLAQVYGIVKQHKGHIDVSTEVGAGTTFTLYLPALLASPPESPAQTTTALIQGQGEMVLVVEDNAALREALADSLEVLNYRVLQAANGREALDILEQHVDKIALVLTDVVMPEMGGQALFHTLRQRDPNLPVVMLTGHPMEKELENLKAQGLAGWLLKPPDLEQLAELLAQALGAEK